jgi:hypothetical protein
VAFPLSLLLVMTLGLLQIAVPLPPGDWSYRHLWPLLSAGPGPIARIAVLLNSGAWPDRTNCRAVEITRYHGEGTPPTEGPPVVLSVFHRVATPAIGPGP